MKLTVTSTVIFAATWFACAGTAGPSTAPSSAVSWPVSPSDPDPDPVGSTAPADPTSPSTSPAAPAPANPEPAALPVSPGGPTDIKPFPYGSLSVGTVWQDCVKSFVEAQNEKSREILIDALATYRTSCDKVERTIVAKPPIVDGSSIGLYVIFSKATTRAWLRIEYHGEDWIFATRVKLAADDFRWTSQPLSFSHDNYGEHVWEVAAIPYTQALRSIVTKMVTAKESIIRFEGQRGTSDLVVADETKAAIVLMTKAIAAIKR